MKEWNWDQTNRQYILPFNTNEIESIELIYYGRSDYPKQYSDLVKTGDNIYSNRNCSLSLSNNVITIIDNEGSSTEYKFKVNFK